MEMRKLGKDEVKMCEKSIKVAEKELKHLDFLRRYEELMVEEGCWWNYMEKLKGHRSLVAEVENDIKMNEEKIRVLRVQIKDGVEVKPRPSGVG